MKRVRSACVLQTLVFSQKPELGFNKDEALNANRQEIEHYKAMMQRARNRYQITKEEELSDGSVVIYVKKQYNDKVDVSEYFE